MAQGGFGVVQQVQGIGTAPEVGAQIKAVQGGQQQAPAVGTGHQGKGGVARQRSVLPGRAQVQHMQGFQLGVAGQVKHLVLRPVQGGLHLLPMGVGQGAGFLSGVGQRFALYAEHNCLLEKQVHDRALFANAATKNSISPRAVSE